RRGPTRHLRPQLEWRSGPSVYRGPLRRPLRWRSMRSECGAHPRAVGRTRPRGRQLILSKPEGENTMTANLAPSSDSISFATAIERVRDGEQLATVVDE